MLLSIDSDDAYRLTATEPAKGRRLGFIGGRVVAEFFIVMLLSDPTSILSVTSRWRPHKGEFGCRKTGDYRMSALLFYAGGGGP